MKYVLFIFIVPITSSLLIKLKDVTDCATQDYAVKNASKFFGIPLENDQTADLQKFEVLTNKEKWANLAFPTNPKVDPVDINPEIETKVCLQSSQEKPNISGVGYFVDKGIANDSDVYVYLDKNYTIDISHKYTIVFSKYLNGSTLRIPDTKKNISFGIYSGLPTESDYLLYSYDSNLKLNEFAIQEDHFYITNYAEGFQIEVSNGAAPNYGSNYTSSGLILTPRFPNMPPSDYLSRKIQLAPAVVDRAIQFKLFAIQAVDSSADSVEALAETPTQSNIKITLGYDKCEIMTIPNIVLSGICSFTVPKDYKEFQINSTKSAYSIQFDIDENSLTTAAPSSNSTLATESSTKGIAATSPTSFPTTSPHTCSECSCSTTEPSTTPDGASTSNVLSLITIFSVYYIV